MTEPRSDHGVRVWQLSLAALLHDVGKFAQRAEADREHYRSEANLHEFACTDEQKRVSHHHAAYTWQFIDEHWPWLLSLGEGGNENVAGWAARHHKPGSVCDWVITEADRLSAGMDRGHPDESAGGWATVQSRRLIPLTARIHGFEDKADHRVPFVALDFAGQCFPKGGGDPTGNRAVEEYRALFDAFSRSAREIPGDDLPRFFRSTLSLYERYAWCVPAATNALPRDVSLFEHSRVASAIAAALTAQLLHLSEWSEQAVKDRDAVRYALVVGDLSGIQRFLYTIVTRNAARALRGRSLFLQLLADGIGNHLLGRFGMPPPNLLYSGGGKLWLLLPAFAAEEIACEAEGIDLWLQQEYGGRLGFTVGLAPFNGRSCVGERVAERLRAATLDMLTRRRQCFQLHLRSDYAKVFDPFGMPGRDTLCRVCGKL